MTQAPTPPARDPRIPPLSLILGFGPVALLPLLALIAWAVPLQRAWVPVGLAQILGATLLIFLAGVRRGLSFYTEGGPRPAQIVTAAWLFLWGVAGLALPPALALPALLVGYGSVAVTDPPAARRGEVPAHFARLRPAQMMIAALGLIALTLRIHLG